VIESTSLDPDRLAPDATNPAVSAVMRDEVVFCLPSTPVDAVAKLMADNDLTEIPVLIDRKPVGYVQATDIVARLVTGDVVVTGSDQVRMPATATLAKDVLRTPVLLIDEGQRLGEAVSLMRSHNRTLALVMHEDDSPVGMISVREIAAHAVACRSQEPLNV